MTKFALIFISLLIQLRAEACVFENMDMQFYDEGNELVEVIKQGPTPYPARLFRSLRAQISDFDETSCMNHIEAKLLKDRKTQELYTAFVTSDDDCDGGNVYGAIVKGERPLEENAVAYIRDSQAICLK